MPDGRGRRAPDAGRRASRLSGVARSPTRERARALRARRTQQLATSGALPRAHRRGRAGPARLRALGQARRLRLLDPGYDRWLEAFLDHAGVERFSLVVHDWGVVGLHTAQRLHQRLDRLVVIGRRAAPPRLQLAPLRPHLADAAGGRDVHGADHEVGFPPDLEGGERRTWTAARGDDRLDLAALRPRHPAGDPQALPLGAAAEVLEQAGATSPASTAPRSCSWPTRDPYIGAGVRARPTRRPSGEVTLRELDDAGHWPWLDRPELVADVARFLSG